MMVWAFNKVDEDQERQLVYESVKNGKSRFGWSQNDKSNLLLKDNWSEWHSKQLFLLQIQPGDWIVHINTPVYGQCVAGKVKSLYSFDDGLKCSWGVDFRHNLELEKDSIIEFSRRDPNILPSVNLNPRQRYHRISAIDDFLKSIDNLRNNSVNLEDSETREEYHLKEKTEPLLENIINLVHEMNRSKQLERYLAKVFRNIPGIIDVNENGFGWGTDHGADLIITMSTSLSNIEFENRIIIQIKSFGGEHYDLSAIDQIKTGINKYNGTAGLIITTAKKTEPLEDKIKDLSDELEKPIDLLAHTDLAKFIIKHSPDLLFKLDGIT